MHTVKVGVIGVSGYTGAELIRLLVMHPHAELVKVGSRSAIGQQVSELYPGLAGVSLRCTLPEESYSGCEYVFLALPHGVSMDFVPSLVEAGTKVIDLSADYRFSQVSVYEQAYGLTHKTEVLAEESVYGLTEYYREQVAKARVVGNPGCYPTATLLALKPLITGGLVEPWGIIVDAKSGVSGAGRGVARERLLGELNENFRAYKPVGHRHTAEINHYIGPGPSITFTPHLLPIRRGILATCYLTLVDNVQAQDIERVYALAYQDEPFVHCHPRGVLPELRWVVGSNSCHIGFEVDDSLRRLIVVSVVDNLLKGAAGQAIQNLNVMAGLPEVTGLPINAPVI